MKLGMINSYDAAAFDRVAARGLDFIEICCNFDNETEALNSSGDAILADINRTGVKIGSIGRWNALPNVGGKVDQNVVAALEKSIDVAAKVGSPVFVCGCNADDSVSLYRNIVCAVEYFGMLCEYAKTKGVRVAVYNCDWSNFCYGTDTWKIVLGELPDLGVKYDCSHACNRGTDYLRELDMWGDRVRHIHVKGTLNIGGRHVDDPPAGLDGLNWSAIMGILYAHRYDGGLSIEPHSGIWQGGLGEHGVDFTIEYMKKLLFR